MAKAIVALIAQLAGINHKLVNPAALLALLVFQAVLLLQFAHHALQVNTATLTQSSVVFARLAHLVTYHHSTAQLTAPSAQMVSRVMQLV